MTRNVKTFDAGRGHENYRAARAWANNAQGWNLFGADTWANDDYSSTLRLLMDRVTGAAVLVEYRKAAA
jgi:hypothetical protein